MRYAELRRRHREEMLAALPGHVARLDWPVERIGVERDIGLRRLLRVATDRSPWHRERLRGIDVERFSVADLPALPTMTKDDLMENFDEIVTDPRLTLDVVNPYIESLTDQDAYLLDTYHAAASGGSSGRRGVFLYDWEGWKTYFLVPERWSARAVIRNPALRLSPGAVGAAVVADKASHASVSLYETFAHPAHRFPATLPLGEIVDGLNRVRPASLFAYASMLHLLASEAAAGRLSISPHLVVSCCEPLLSETRAAVEALWPARVVNNFGTTEGLWGITCGEADGAHLPDDLVIVEPVDEANNPVALGGSAEKLFITNLYNLTQPLIRYELADRVDFIEDPCPCGSMYTRLSGVRGRLDDVFVYQDGTRVHPIVFRSVLGRDTHVVEYQVRQTARGASIMLRGDAGMNERDIVSSIEHGLRRVGLRDPKVEVTIAHAIPRQATGKLRRFVPMVGEH